MPIRYEIRIADRLVVSTAEGLVTNADFVEHQSQLARDRVFDPSFDHLFDLRSVEGMKVSSSQIRRTAEARLFSEASKRAVVAPQDVVFGSVRMYQAYRDATPGQIRLFRDYSDALEWLGLSESAPENGTA